MSNFPVVRAKSVACLPRQREIEREGIMGTLTRVTSVPNISSMYVNPRYQSSTLYKYRRNRDSLDDYWHDRYIVNSTLHWKDYRYNAQRHVNVNLIPNSFNFGYSSFWSRYRWLNPQYWRVHRNPYYNRPLYDSRMFYHLDQNNQKRAIKLFRRGIISFQFLDKNWITPNELSRKDWDNIYTPTARYGARRYFYSFAT